MEKKKEKTAHTKVEEHFSYSFKNLFFSIFFSFFFHLSLSVFASSFFLSSFFFSPYFPFLQLAIQIFFMLQQMMTMSVKEWMILVVTFIHFSVHSLFMNFRDRESERKKKNSRTKKRDNIIQEWHCY